MKNTKKRTDSFKKTYKNNCESLLDDNEWLYSSSTNIWT
jgi:hypothetical protein